MIDPTSPIQIDPNAIYDDGVLVLSLGLSQAAIVRARRNGHLRYNRSGHRILYRGQWIINWLETDPDQARQTGGAQC